MKRIIISLLIIISCTSMVLADGSMFGPRAIKKAPDIPTQRAIMVYRDGVEQLIIESSLDGQGKEFGWIIPLPSAPSEFKAMSSGIVETMSQTIQPVAIDGIIGISVYIISFFVLAWFIVIVTSQKTRTTRLVELLVIIAIPLFLMSIMMSSLGRSGGNSVGGVDIIDTQEIGSYGLTVLNAKNPVELDEWLTANGFANLNAKAINVVSVYIKQGWCFVAAKLKRDGQGYSRPHPLSMAFKSKSAVYPMKLTGTVGSDLYLELFVVADKYAEANKLKLDFADTFDFSSDANRSYSAEQVKQNGYIGQTYTGARIGHPEIFDIMWDGCVISRFSGSFSPRQMDKDILVELKSGEPHFKVYLSHTAALSMGAMFGCLVLSAILIVAGFLCYGRFFVDGGKVYAFKRILVPALILSIIVAAGVYVAVDKVEGKRLGLKKWSRSYLDASDIEECPIDEV